MKNSNTITRMRKAGKYTMARRLCRDHYYHTEGNLHVTFPQRPTAETMEAIKKMVEVARDHLNRLNPEQQEAAAELGAAMKEASERANTQPAYPIYKIKKQPRQ